MIIPMICGGMVASLYVVIVLKGFIFQNIREA